MQDDTQEGIVDVNFAVYSMKPSFRNLFMKKLTRDLASPIIVASISCDILGAFVAGLAR